MSGVFVNVNRGKRSVVLDLQTDAGKAALRALIERADVFIHSMRSKAIAKLGFGYDDVAAINPAHRLHELLWIRSARTRPRPPRLRRHHPGRMRIARGAAATDRPGRLRRHHHGRQGGRADRGVRDDDGAVPPRAHGGGPGGRGRDVRDHGILHAGRTCQRRHVRPPARDRPSIRAPWRPIAGRIAPATVTSPR